MRNECNTSFHILLYTLDKWLYCIYYEFDKIYCIVYKATKELTIKQTIEKFYFADTVNKSFLRNKCISMVYDELLLQPWIVTGFIFYHFWNHCNDVTDYCYINEC